MKFFKGTFSLILTLMLMTQNSFAQINEPKEIVEVSIQKVMLAIETGQDTFDQNPEEITTEMTVILEPVVAFDSIANAVMGKYKKEATEKQKKLFVETFKRTMVKLYAKALISFESKSIEVLQPSEEDVSPRKAKIMSHVTAEDGTVYKVIYSMRKNKQGEWQARNMIVDGINLGLTYLNQFDSAMNRYSGDMDKVIASWHNDLGDEDGLND
jgi:phospholipid transport system substrate-binding protein